MGPEEGWPVGAREVYTERLGIALDLGMRVERGDIAEAIAREEAEIVAAWHRGWPTLARRAVAAARRSPALAHATFPPADVGPVISVSGAQEQPPQETT